MIEEFNKYLATTGGKLPLLSYHVAPISKCKSIHEVAIKSI